eukprot:6645539-Prymnesium_polylepis.1
MPRVHEGRVSVLSRSLREFNTLEHATRDARHETVAGAASCTPLSCPITQQTIPDPPNLPYPTSRCLGSASALLAAPPAHCLSSSRLPARSPASPAWSLELSRDHA